MSTIGTLSNSQTSFSADVRRLKAGTELKKATQAAKEDGLDQIFVKSGKTIHVLQGRGLDLADFDKSIKDGQLPKVQLVIGDETISGKVVAVDNEVNSAFEGIKTVAPVAAAAGAIGLMPLGIEMVASAIPVLGGLGGAALGFSVVDLKSNDLRTIVGGPLVGGVIGATVGSFGGNILRTLTGASDLKKVGMISAATGAVVAGLVVAGGAAYGANRSGSSNKLNALTEK